MTIDPFEAVGRGLPFNWPATSCSDSALNSAQGYLSIEKNYLVAEGRIQIQYRSSCSSRSATVAHR